MVGVHRRSASPRRFQDLRYIESAARQNKSLIRVRNQLCRYQYFPQIPSRIETRRLNQFRQTGIIGQLPGLSRQILAERREHHLFEVHSCHDLAVGHRQTEQSRIRRE